MMLKSGDEDEEDFSDFDNSDEDLGSLLADDDDDDRKITKKPVKDSISSLTSSVTKEEKPVYKNSQKSAKEVSSSNYSENKYETGDDNFNDILTKSTIPSLTKNSKKSSLTKSVLHKDNKSTALEKIDDILTSSSSIQNRNLKSKPSSSDRRGDDENNILQSFGSSGKNSSPQKSGSFFDDFLKTLSPKQSPEKSLLKKENDPQEDISNKDETEDDILARDFPNLQKKKPIVPKDTPLAKKRQSFVKQVSFKDLPSTEEDDEIKEKHPEMNSEKLETPKQFPQKTTESTNRLEKMGASRSDETDWLNFFKDSPKRSRQPPVPDINKKTSEPKMSDLNAKLKTRRSSAVWLGLSENEDAEAANELPKPTMTKNLNQGTRRSQMNSNDENWLESDLKAVSSTQKSFAGSNKSNMVIESEMNEGLLEHSKSDTQLGSRNLNFSLNSEPQSQLSHQHFNKTITKSNSSGIKTNHASLGQNNQEIANASVMESNVTSSSNSPYNPTINSEYALQTMMNNFALEKDQLIKSSESIKTLYEERIKTMEVLHKDQFRNLEEFNKATETKMKSELMDKVKDYEEKLTSCQNEKHSIEKKLSEKLEFLEKENARELGRLKDLYNQTISSVKQEHEEALQRLKRLKDQEVEAVLSTQAHSKSLQQLSDQLEARTAELSQLQLKVDERNQVTLKEKQSFLDAKEKDLKNLQSRLQRQHEEGEEERHRLQQLVLKLESRLQKSTTEGEEDRWDVQQMKSRLLVQQKHLDEEYKINVLQIEKEKEKIRMLQDSLLHEQKTVLLQLAQERQQIMREKVDIDLLAKKLKEDENRFNIKKMKEESYLEKGKLFIQQEESKLQFEKSSLKQEAQLVEQMQETLQKERQALNNERTKLNELNYKIRQKESEIEHLARISTEDKDKAERDCNAAQKIQSEQKYQMQEITHKLQLLMNKEKDILIEKEKISAQKMELEKLQNSTLCNKCKLSLGFPVNVPHTESTIPFQNNMSPMPSVAMIPQINGISNPLNPSRFDPSLVVWYVTAQRDREYLQEELSFLKSLKDSSKNKNT